MSMIRIQNSGACSSIRIGPIPEPPPAGPMSSKAKALLICVSVSEACALLAGLCVTAGWLAPAHLLELEGLRHTLNTICAVFVIMATFLGSGKVLAAGVVALRNRKGP